MPEPAGAGPAAVPALWDRLAGQDRVGSVLQAAAVAPGDTYLFTGPPGVGQAEAARVFAAAILCPRSCGTCSTCSRVLRGIHPDVVILEPEGYTYPVEVLRDAVGQASRSPMEGARRVMIVEEADRITEFSQNALLKALEEPNPSVTWVLVAGILEPLLPTVLSRCTIVEFTPIAEDAMARLLAGRRALPAAQADHIVRATRGDLERALALVDRPGAAAVRTLAIDYAVAVAEGRCSPQAALALGARVALSAQEARAERETALAAELAELEDMVRTGPGTRGGGPGGAGRGAASVKRRLGDRAKRVLRRAETDVYLDFVAWLGQAFRDLAALSAGADPGAVSAPDRLAALQAAAPLRPPGYWLALAEESLRAQSAIRENAQPVLAVEGFLLAPVAFTLQQ